MKTCVRIPLTSQFASLGLLHFYRNTCLFFFYSQELLTFTLSAQIRAPLSLPYQTAPPPRVTLTPGIPTPPPSSGSPLVNCFFFFIPHVLSPAEFHEGTPRSNFWHPQAVFHYFSPPAPPTLLHCCPFKIPPRLLTLPPFWLAKPPPASPQGICQRQNVPHPLPYHECGVPHSLFHITF